jgi:hypothetical protein
LELRDEVKMAEEEVQAITKPQITRLKKSGFSKSDILKIGKNIEKVSRAGISKDGVNKAIDLIIKDSTFKRNFFEDPLTAIKKLGK